MAARRTRSVDVSEVLRRIDEETDLDESNATLEEGRTKANTVTVGL